MATCKDFDTGSDQITQLCNLCDSNVSDGYCDECEDHMCQSCFDIHSRVKTCRHHVLLNDKCQKGNTKTYSEQCTRHPIQSIKFYCVAHKMVGCVECFFLEHRNCNYQNIETAAKLFQDSGKDTRIKKEIQRLENKHSEYTRQYEEDKETVAVYNNTVVTDVKSFTGKVHSYVEQVEKHMLEKSERLRIENETLLERRSDYLDSIGTEIEKCKMKLENEESVDRLFISTIGIGPTMEKLRKNIASIGHQHVVTKYEFQPNKLIMDMTNGSGSFGDICILPDAETDSTNKSTESQFSTVAKVDEDLQNSDKLSLFYKRFIDDGFDIWTQGSDKLPLFYKRFIDDGIGIWTHGSDELHTLLQHANNINKNIQTAVQTVGASIENCVICMDTLTDPKTIQCGHTFCAKCIDQQFRYKKQCPICGKVCGTITGDQPEGTMTSEVRYSDHLPGYDGCGSIAITYTFLVGRQKSNHPSPGMWYKGKSRTAYLPYNNEGKTIWKLLVIAFERKLTFTIGNSMTTGQQGVITWNGIHHKTDNRPDTHCGYPDPTYLARVKYELAAKGVTEEDIRHK